MFFIKINLISYYTLQLCHFILPDSFSKYIMIYFQYEVYKNTARLY